MKIFYTYNAIDDLERLYEFIAKDSMRAAKVAAEKIQGAVARLLEFPLLGKELMQQASPSMRDLITGDYIIRYAVLQKEIHILRIWHGKEERRVRI